METQAIRTKRDDDVRHCIEAAIARRKDEFDGRLPYDSMPRFWGGPGDGEQCDACDTRITKEQLVMEALPPYSPVKSLFNFTCSASTPGMPRGAYRSRSAGHFASCTPAADRAPRGPSLLSRRSR